MAYFSVATLALLVVPTLDYAAEDGQEATRVTSRQLIETTTLSGVAISPNGRFVSVRVETPSVDQNRVALEWRIVDLGTLESVTRLQGEDAERSPSGALLKETPSWSSDSQSIYFKSLRGNELAIWRLGIDGHSEKLVSSAADIETFVLDQKSNRLLYTVGATREELLAAKRRELESGVVLDGTQNPASALEDNMPYRDGMASIRLATYHWYPVGDGGERRTMAFDLGTRTSRRLAFADQKVFDDLKSRMDGINAEGPGSGATASIGRGKEIDSFGQNEAPWVLNLKRNKTSTPEQCAEPSCRDLTGQVVWRPQTDEFVFTTAGLDGVFHIWAWEATRRAFRLIYAAPGVISSNGSEAVSNQCPINHNIAVCVVEQATQPPKLIRIQLKDGRVDTLYDPNSLLRKSVQEIPIEYMSWTDARGLTHSGVFVRPRRQEGVVQPPLVITSYVCAGFLRGGTGQTTPEFVLAASGIAVLCTNADADLTAPAYTSGDVPTGQATRLQYMLDGWTAAVRLLSERNWIDKGRVGISGLSFTGEAVNYAVTHSNFAQAAVSGHMGILDPINYYIFSGSGDFGRAIINGYGLLDPDTVAGSDFYRAASSAKNTTRLTAPLLVQTNEYEFHYGLQYYGELRRQRKPAEIIVFPNESHVFWQPIHQAVMNERNIDWFRFWLQNYEEPSPEKRNQYARWEKMREDQRQRSNSNLLPRD